MVSFPTWVSTCCSGNLCWLASLLRDVTGEPCWNHGVYLVLVLRWDEIVVTLLILRRYGVYKVFDSPSLSQPILRRESSGPSGSSLRESENTDALRPLNCPILDPPTGGWSNPSVRMGRSPAHVQGFWGHAHVI